VKLTGTNLAGQWQLSFNGETSAKFDVRDGAAAITNARAYLALREQGLTLDDYLWAFVDGKPIVNDWPDRARPARTELSDRISKDLAKRGFKFVGSTIVYAYMQGIGMVDDHDRECHCRTRRR
jgi:DNA-3-methyladenine glycosylase I